MKLKLNLLQVLSLKRGQITGVIISILIGTPTIAQPNSHNTDALVSPGTSAVTKTVQLTLSDTINLLLQNNQDLKNAALDRIVQRQQLREAENAFSPTIQPVLGLGMSQTLSNPTTGAASFSSASPINGTDSSSTAVNPTTGAASSSSASPIDGTDSFSTANIDTFAPNSNFTQTAQVSGQLKTPLGTTLTLTVDPFQSQRISATVTQPLLRGFGSAVNEAPLERARFNEKFNSLELRKTLADQITQASTSYRALARAQEALRIQQLSLENQRQQLEFVRVLVNAGRRARADLVEVEANIASTRTQLIAAKNSLEQAKSDLLNLLDVEETLNIVVPQKLIEEFRAEAIPGKNLNALTLNRLLKIAYTNRPEYLQAKSSIQMTELDLLIARDNKRFSLDLQASATLGDNSEMSTKLSLTRVFGNQSLETAFQQNRIDLLKRQNELAKIESDIEIEVESRFRDVNSSRERVTAARRARELAERRLEITRERFRLGREDIFQVVSLQNEVVTAQNEEVNAKIDFLDAVTQLEQALGVTLNTWKEEIASSGLLTIPPKD